MNISQIIETAQNLFPEKQALIYKNQTFNYNEINRLANQIALGLQQAGISKGDRVVLCLPNMPAFLISFFGTLKTGAISVAINPEYQTDEINYILNDSGAETMITTRECLKKMATIQSIKHIFLSDDSETTISFQDGIVEKEPDMISVNMKKDDPAVILYTSGTTGNPKGATLTHENLMFSARSCAYTFQMKPEDKILLSLPVFHSFAQTTVMLPGFYACATILLLPEFETQSVISHIDYHSATQFFGVPAMYKQLILKASKKQMQSIHTFFSSAASLPIQLSEQWLKTFGKQIHEIYGSTETSMLTFNHYLKYQPLSAGSPPEGIDINIIDDKGNVLDTNSTGEITIKGKNVMAGYWNNTHETTRAIQSGWFHTGDIGRIDQNGYLTITDRKKDMINVGGFKVYPSEVENVIFNHPAVSDVAVYGAFDDLMGEQVIANIVLKPGHSCDETEIISFASTHLVSFKVPSVIHFVERIPKSKTGKVLKRVLRETHAKQCQTISKSKRPALKIDMKQHVENTIKHFIRTQFPDEEIELSINRTFTDMGVDSIMAMTMVHQLNEILGIQLKTSDIFNHVTIEQLTNYILSIQVHLPNNSFTRVDKKIKSNRIPLSYGQLALWYIYRLAPNSPSYNACLSIRIKGELDITALKKTFQHIIQQHDCLRTIFIEEQGQVCQKVLDDQPIDFVITDVSQCTPESILSQAKSAQQQCFNLEKGPLLRINLFEQSHTNSILVITLHHIIFDGWSLWYMIESMNSLYKAFAHGKKPELIKPQKTYADFVLWQKEMNSGKQRECHKNYWLSKLENITPVINLPTDYPHPPVQTFQGDAVSFALSNALSQQIISLSKQFNTSVYTVLLTAYQTLLYRYTNQDDILIGSPMSGRTNPQFNDIVGYCINTVVLRSQFSDEMLFIDLLKNTRKTVLEAIDHQDYPFPLLIEDLNIERDASRSPLIQVKFFFQQQQTLSTKNYIGLLSPDPEVKPQLKVSGLDMESFPMTQQEGQFDLSLEMMEIQGRLVGMFDYNKALFEKESIHRTIGHFNVLLNAIVKNPSQPICQLPLLTPKEKNQLIIEWNNTFVDYPKDKCMHQLFEAQVKKAPNAIAATFENKNLTYMELEQRANALAHYLQSLGVSTETLVGICMERSLDMMIGLMGILKAGGAYVPIDPGYPKDRVEYMRKDANVRIILTQKKFEYLISDENTQLIVMDKINLNLSHTNPPLSNVMPHNAMYVLYTSGSTGKPKGAINTHVALVNRILWMQDAYQLNHDDNVLQKTPFSFDVSGWEFFWPLITGARLVFAKPEGHKDPNYLIQIIQKENITTLHFVPPMLQSFLNADSVTDCQSLRHVICSGEALPFDLQKHFFNKLNAKLHNLYGPTEAAIDVTYWECNQNNQLSTVPIGKPIANTQMYILDRQLRPVPINVPGELHIGGIQVARGYLNRPELNREKFIKDPFSKLSDARLYKTGDLAKYLPDGNIEFLGRLDHQIKLRGLRIELGEIESCLQEHHLVGETVIRLHEDRIGKRLVAYATRTPVHSDISDENRTHDVKSFLKTKLPEYMVPAIIMWMDQFPLSPNGKIDRKSLPEPVIQRLDSHTPPKTHIEKQLVTIWSELLQFDEPISIHDNFFDIGGDSILSLQVVARAKEMGLHMSNNDILKYQTIAELANVVRFIAHRTHDSEDFNGHFLLTPIQKSFFQHTHKNPEQYSQYAILNCPNDIQPDILKHAFAALLDHHDSLRLIFNKQGNEWVQSYSQIKYTPFSVTVLNETSEKQFYEAIQSRISDIHTQFNLSCGPLVKMELVTSFQKNCLLFCAHHLIVDSISWRIIIKDLTTAYQQILNNKKIVLPEKTSSFKRWVTQLHQFQNHADLIEELPYWQKTLQKQTLPLDFPEGKNTFDSIHHVDTHLNELKTDQLLNVANRVYQTTIEELMLTALAQTLHKWMGNEGCVIDLESHGRSHWFESIDLSETVGWFTTIYPVRLYLSNPDNCESSIMDIKHLLRSVPNKGIGYNVLKHIAEHPCLENETSSPILFNYLGQFDQQSSESLFSFTQNAIGIVQNNREIRDGYIEIIGWIRNGCLHFQWHFSKNCHTYDNINHLANEYLESLRQIIDHCYQLYQKKLEDPSHLLMPLQTQRDNTPLFCIPGLQGDPKYFQAFAFQLKSHFSVYGLCSPEIVGQSSQPSIEKLASLYIQSIKTIQPQGPYHIIGHSFGALIAFEMACQLEQHNEFIATITIFDQPAPQPTKNIECNKLISHNEQLVDYIRWLELSNNLKTDISLEIINSSIDIFAYASKQLEKAGIAVEKNRLMGMMMAFTNNMHLLKSYIPSYQFKSPMTVFQAQDNTKLDLPDMFSEDRFFQMWKMYTKDTIQFNMVSGNHFNMFSMPHVKSLATHYIHSVLNPSPAYNNEIKMQDNTIVNSAIEKYVHNQITDEPDYLKELANQTRSEMHYSFMMSSAIEGRFLKMLVQIFQPKCILEIGTFTGYSTLSMAEGLGEKGKIITCEISNQALRIAQNAFDHSPFANKISIKKGPALKSVYEIDQVFDFAFIDADKQTYPAYYEAVVSKIQPGGIIVIDNALFFGRVIDPDLNDPDAKAINQLNEIIKHDDRVDNVLLTVRDGIQLVRKKI